MTPEAQSALRRIMEAYSRVTRFCLICNYVTRVIEPLASRCAKFRFKPLPAESMISRMTQISATENVRLAPGSLDAILHASGGDMRKAVTYLQSAHQLSGGNEVTSEMVVDISGQVLVACVMCTEANAKIIVHGYHCTHDGRELGLMSSASS